MFSKVAAALIATTLIATPVFAARSTASSPATAPLTQSHAKAKVGLHGVKKSHRHLARHIKRGTKVVAKQHGTRHVAAKKHGVKVVKLGKHNATSHKVRISARVAPRTSSTSRAGTY